MAAGFLRASNIVRKKRKWTLAKMPESPTLLSSDDVSFSGGGGAALVEVGLARALSRWWSGRGRKKAAAATAGRVEGWRGLDAGGRGSVVFSSFPGQMFAHGSSSVVSVHPAREEGGRL